MTARRSWQRGLSLVELLIVMLLGTLICAGIIAVFVSTSGSYLSQTQMAHLQEEGRFAMTQIKGDLAMTGAQYCNSTGGNAHSTSAGIFIDGLRQPTVYARDGHELISALSDVTTPWGGSYPPAPTEPYSLPAFFVMRGYDCSLSSCTPIDPSSKKNANGFNIPAMGAKVGDRVLGAAVLTLRYLDPSRGWKIFPESAGVGSSIETRADGSLTVRLVKMPGEPDVTDFAASDPLAMLADCSGAQIFAVAGQSSHQIVSTGNNFVQPVANEGMSAPMFFDLSRDFLTVTYYLKVVDNGRGQGQTTGALVRRVNGGNTSVRNGSNETIAQGIERLDFRYGVQLADGNVRYYTASQVDASSRADCGTTVPLPITGSDDRGCLWRSISLVEIDLLVDGRQPIPTLKSDELYYTYAADHPFWNSESPKSPTDSSRKVTPIQQGFPVSMQRREFTAAVPLRNFVP